MARTRKPSLLTVLLAAAGLLLVVELSWWWRMRELDLEDGRRFDAQRRELAALLRSTPAPTPEEAERLVRETARLSASLGELESWWSENRSVSAWRKLPVPADRRAAYFDLAGYRQRMTAMAARAQVGLPAGEAFGFKAYVNEGPAEDIIAWVFQQRLVLEEALGLLLRCHPTAFGGVSREEEIPAPPAALSLWHEGAVETQAFEVRFTGRTTVLRDWLNALAASDLPVVVRNVVVQPVTADTPRSPAVISGVVLNPADDGFSPLAGPQDRSFAVSLEYLEWVKPAAGGEDES